MAPIRIAFLNSPRCSNEESYLLQKLARSVIGTNNVDHGAGVYCNNSINVLLDMMGVPATTNSIDELATSEVISWTEWTWRASLPTVGGAVIRAKLQRGQPDRDWCAPPPGGRNAPISSCSSSRYRSAALRGDGEGHR